MKIFSDKSLVNESTLKKKDTDINDTVDAFLKEVIGEQKKVLSDREKRENNIKNN